MPQSKVFNSAFLFKIKIVVLRTERQRVVRKRFLDHKNRHLVSIKYFFKASLKEHHFH